MDPHLWSVLDGPADDEVVALVRLAPGADQAPPGVRVVARFGDVATVRLCRGALLTTRAHPWVVSLKASLMVRPEPVVARRSRRAARPGRRSLGPGGPSGRGTVIGVVDWGCDFTHPNLLTASGRTRLRALWDQRPRRRRAPRPYGYGVVHRAADIDRALGARDPFDALGYDPLDFDADGSGTHGTHVIDIAAGDPQVGPGGMAPGAELVFVHLADPPTGPRGIGSSVSLVEAVHFIACAAAGRPCVINLSLGALTGPHDGTLLVERALDAAATGTPGLVVVQSCGNYALRPIHTTGRLRTGERATIDWRVDRSDDTPNEMEVWYPGTDALSVELFAPDGARVVHAPPDSHGPIVHRGRIVGRYGHRTHDPNNGDHHALLRVDPLGGGDWRVVLHGLRVERGEYHVWIERDELRPGSQSRLSRVQAVHSTTTGTISNGRHTIAVGAYDPETGGAASFSSRGPTRDGRPKPDLLAPGVGILAARSAPADEDDGDRWLTRKSGTSMAAPHVTGTVALLFEAAGRALTASEVKRILVETAARVDGGPGLLDVRAAVARARRASAVPAAAESLAEDERFTTLMRADAPRDASQPGVVRRVVFSGGVRLLPDAPKGKWVGGQDLARQVAARILAAMAAPDAAASHLDAVTEMVRRAPWDGGSVNRHAKASEPIGAINVRASLAYAVHARLADQGLRDSTVKLASTLRDEEVARLERALLLEQTAVLYAKVWSQRYPWMNERMLRDFAWSRRRHLDAMHAAVDWPKWQADTRAFLAGQHDAPWVVVGGPEQAAAAARSKPLVDAWDQAVAPFLAVRDDAKLVAVPGYGFLWKVKDGGPATDASVVNAVELRRFLTFAELRRPDVATAALSDGDARRRLLEEFARYSLAAQKHDTSALGTGELAEAPGLANAPPLPSALATSPAVAPPDFFLPVGAEIRASMQLTFPDVYEAFREFGYRWELVRVPEATIDAALRRGGTLGAQHVEGAEAPGLGDALGNQVDRRLRYARADVARVVSALDAELGPAALGAGSIVAMGAIAGFVGEVILSVVEWLTAKRDEKRVALREPGMFILRCIATPVLLESADLIRPPSAAYLPLWVRPVEEVAEAEADRQLASLVKLRAVLLEMEQELQDPKRATPELRARYAELKVESEGTVDAVLAGVASGLRTQVAAVRKRLDEAAGALKRELEAELKKVEDHLDELRNRQMKRSAWYGELDPHAPRQEDLVRFRGVLVTDEGHIVALLADAWRNPRTGDYHVFDSTDARGGTERARDDDPVVAVRKALQDLLESDAHNHGRGYCTIDVPRSREQWIRQGFRVDLKPAAAFVHSLEATAQLATAIALVFVAFTPVSAAAILLPLGLIGAIPSAYRLVNRISEPSFGLDLAAAMDIVNLLASGIGLGQVTAGSLRFLRLSHALVVTGVGYDGLGVLLLTLDVGDKIAATAGLPAGARRAEVARILAGSLGPLGLAKVSGMLARFAEHERAKGAGTKEVPVPLERASAAVNRHFAELVDAPVPVHVEPEPAGPAQPAIRFDQDGYHLPSGVRLVLPEAEPKPGSYDKYARPMRTMVEIDRLAAGVRHLLDEVDGLSGRGRKFPEHSRAGDARLAIESAPQQLYAMAEQVAKGTLTPDAADQRLGALRQELSRHELALQELAAGKAFLANREAAAKRAIAAGYEKPPADHYVVDGPGGTYALRRRVDATGPEKRYDPKTKKVAPGPAPAKAPQTGGTGRTPPPPPPPTTTPPPPPPPAGFDPALVQFEAEKLLPKVVVVRPAVAGQDDVRVKPPLTTGGGYYVITAPADTPHATVMAAVDQHVRLSRLRPAQPERGASDRRVIGRKAAWSGAEEAAWRGYPPYEEGQRWIWRGNDIVYQRASKSSPGRSYDRAKDSYGPPARKESGPPRFVAGDDAMEALGANDPNSDFGAWVGVVTGEVAEVRPLLGLAAGKGLPLPGGQGHVTREWLRARIGDPTGRTHASVRKDLQKPFRPTLLKALADQQALRRNNPKLEAEARRNAGRPPVDPDLIARQMEAALADARRAAAQEKALILSTHGGEVWNRQMRAVTKRIYNLLERKHALSLLGSAPPHHQVLYDVQVTEIHISTFDGRPVNRTISLRNEHGGVDRTFDNVVFVASADGEVHGVQPYELKSGGLLDKDAVVPGSVAGGITRGDMQGHFRDKTTIQGQLNMSKKLKQRARDAQGELVLRGRDPVTDEIRTIRVKPDRLQVERLSVYPVSAQTVHVPLGAEGTAALTRMSDVYVGHQASHEAMLGMARVLGRTEGRRIAVNWYQREFLPADLVPAPTKGPGSGFDALYPTPRATADAPVTGVRVHAQPRFTPTDRKRYESAVRRVGRQMKGGNGRVVLGEVRQVFLHPEAAVTNAKWIAERLTSGEPVEFHLFSRVHGEGVWSARDVQRRVDVQGLTTADLADQIRAFASGASPATP